MTVVTAKAANPTGRGQRFHKRIRAVDGLRAVAVAGVLAFHFDLGIPGGFLGVDLFFVISGFVITRLLLSEITSEGRISFGRFWLRRVIRLMPMVLVVIVGTQVAARMDGSPSLTQAVNNGTVASLGYAYNWYSIFSGASYWDPQTMLTPLAHMWSLAVEEQFYLLWPISIAVMCKFLGPAGRLALILCGAISSYALAFLLYQPGAFERAYEGLDTRAGSLLLGAVVAQTLVLVDSNRKIRSNHPFTQKKWLTVAGITSIATLIILWATAGVDSIFLYAGGLALSGVAAAALIGNVVTSPGSIWARALSYSPVVFIGRISYSLYLWHWPVWVFAQRNLLDYTPESRKFFAIILSLALAVASFLLIERPLQRMVRFQKTTTFVLLGTAVAIAGFAIFSPVSTPVLQQHEIVVWG